MKEIFSPHTTKITKAQWWVKISIHTGMKLQKRKDEWKFHSTQDLKMIKAQQNAHTQKLRKHNVMTEFDSFCNIELHALQHHTISHGILLLFAERAFIDPRLLQGDDTCPFYLTMLTNTCNKMAYVEAISIAETTTPQL